MVATGALGKEILWPVANARSEGRTSHHISQLCFQTPRIRLTKYCNRTLVRTNFGKITNRVTIE